MTDEKKPFSFAAPFTAPIPDPEPTPEPAPEPTPEPTAGVTLDDVFSVGVGLSSTWLCTPEEFNEVFAKTKPMRQHGRMRVEYKDGQLTVRRIKD